MPKNGSHSKIEPGQIKPLQRGNESVRLPRAVQRQGKLSDAPKNPYGGKRAQKVN